MSFSDSDNRFMIEVSWALTLGSLRTFLSKIKSVVKPKLSEIRELRVRTN